MSPRAFRSNDFAADWAQKLGSALISLTLAAAALGALDAGAAGGDLLWQDLFDSGNGFDFASAMTTAGNRVFVTGHSVSGASDDDFLVRALDAKSGALLWQDEFDLAGDDDDGQAVAAQGRRVFAVGRGTNGVGDEDVLVRALDAKTGAFLWQDVFDLAGEDDRADALAVKGNRVFVACTGEDAGNRDFLVRAYDAKTGALLWQDRFDLAGDDDSPADIFVQGARVFVSGAAESSDGDDDFVVRAYNAKDGTLIWQDVFDLAGEFDQARTIAVRGSSVFVGATMVPDPAEGSDIAVRALDAKTGQLLWFHRWDSPGTGDGAGEVAVRGSRVFVVGSHSPPGNAFFSVRALDAKSGSVLWDDQFDLAGDFDSAASVAVTGNSVLVAGTVEDLVTDREMAVRAFDAKTGALLWDDVFDLAGGSDQAWKVAVKGRRLFVLGSGLNANPDSDIIVRALDTR